MVPFQHSRPFCQPPEGNILRRQEPFRGGRRQLSSSIGDFLHVVDHFNTKDKVSWKQEVENLSWHGIAQSASSATGACLPGFCSGCLDRHPPAVPARTVWSACRRPGDLPQLQGAHWLFSILWHTDSQFQIGALRQSNIADLL